MKREESKVGEELPEVAVDRDQGSAPAGVNGKAGEKAEWLESGTEDPAFFIKPNDGE